MFKVEYKCIKRKQKGKTVDNAIKFSEIKTSPKTKIKEIDVQTWVKRGVKADGNKQWQLACVEWKQQSGNRPCFAVADGQSNTKCQTC